VLYLYVQITAEEVKDNRAIVMEVEAKNLDKKVDIIILCSCILICNSSVIAAKEAGKMFKCHHWLTTQKNIFWVKDSYGTNCFELYGSCTIHLSFSGSVWEI